MFRLSCIILVHVFVLASFLPANAERVIIATWNIENLRDTNLEGPNRRKQVDYDRLAGYVTQLNADVVALQEVEGADAARRVFDPNEYNLFFSGRDDDQLTGFAVRKALEVTQNPDYED